MSRKCKYLIQRRLIGDKLDRDELLARRNKFLGTQVQPGGERGLAVVAQALRIGYGDEEQIQRRSLRAAPIDEMPLHKGLVNPTELLGNLAEPLGP